MALIGVEPLNEAALERASELAKQWGVPLIKDFSGKSGVKVLVSDISVGLAFVDAKRGKPYVLDFLTRPWRTRFSAGLPKSHIFSRALGYKGKPLKIVDATAGFGQDAMLAVTMGCEVTAIEKSNVVVAVLRNAIFRAMREDESLRAKLEAISVVEADSMQVLDQGKIRPDVIYLDPMFDKPKKSAKSPKEMQLLQELLGEPTSSEESEQLFLKALKCARQRVVVKRPLKGRALGKAPNHSFKGQSIRYDVYLV